MINNQNKYESSIFPHETLLWQNIKAKRLYILIKDITIFWLYTIYYTTIFTLLSIFFKYLSFSVKRLFNKNYPFCRFHMKICSSISNNEILYSLIVPRITVCCIYSKNGCTKWNGLRNRCWIKRLLKYRRIVIDIFNNNVYKNISIGSRYRVSCTDC